MGAGRVVIAAGLFVTVVVPILGQLPAFGVAADRVTYTAPEPFTLPAEAAPPPVLAASLPSPCQDLEADLALAADATESGDLLAADDMALIATALIDQCGWNLTDTTTGGRFR
jgi:hypothetical protein